MRVLGSVDFNSSEVVRLGAFPPRRHATAGGGAHTIDARAPRPDAGLVAVHHVL